MEILLNPLWSIERNRPESVAEGQRTGVIVKYDARYNPIFGSSQGVNRLQARLDASFNDSIEVTKWVKQKGVN